MEYYYKVCNSGYAKNPTAKSCNGILSDTFEVKTGVKQWCILSPVIFIKVKYWIMEGTGKLGQNDTSGTLILQVTFTYFQIHTNI